MAGYYAQHLSGERLRRCYELAPRRVKQYLQAETRYVITHLRPTDTVLELGCGYGRVAGDIAKVVRRFVGIDTSLESIELAERMKPRDDECVFVHMDALNLGFSDGSFDAVMCVQNGIGAFGVDRVSLVGEALRVVRCGGVALFSTYSDDFWQDRLTWFELQAAEALLGPINHAASSDGVIVCQDGFRSERLTPEELRSVCSLLNVKPEIAEVDESSVFLRIVKERER